MIAFALLLQTATPPAPPSADPQFCVRTHLKADMPVDEAYTVVGLSPDSQRPYAGTLEASFQDGHYVLTRRIDTAIEHGEAWAVNCGPDQVALLEVSYEHNRHPLLCKLSVNYDNYSLANCGPNSNTGEALIGLEAWYPASKSGSPVTTRHLVSEGSCQAAYEYHFLNRASAFNDVTGVELLLEGGADPDGKGYKDVTRCIPLAGEFSAPLALAVRNRNMEIVELLLDAGANPNFMEGEGRTPTGLARDTGHGEILKLLIDHGGH